MGRQACRNPGRRIARYHTNIESNIAAEVFVPNVENDLTLFAPHIADDDFDNESAPFTAVGAASTESTPNDENDTVPEGDDLDATDLTSFELDDSAIIEEMLGEPPPPYNHLKRTSSSCQAPLLASSAVLDSTRVMTEIYELGMNRGASIEFMNHIVRKFRDFARQGYNISDLQLRDTFLRNSQQLTSGISGPPKPISMKHPNGGPSFPKFSLLGQILHLIASEEFGNVDNLVINSDPSRRFHKFDASTDEDKYEVNSGKWYSRTYAELRLNPKYDWLFPLIFYIDKTGTDAMQRFSLEPLMFTTTILRRCVREKASAWRHLGFMPPSEGLGMTAEEIMATYHRCLAILLSDLVELQTNPPEVDVTIDGITERRRLILQVAFVMGDQQSQDKHCGRKAVNAGGAGRIHRRCMCSSLAATCTSTSCTPLNKDHIEKVIKACHDGENHYNDVIRESRLPPPASAREEKALKLYVKRRSKFARAVLEKVYSMYPIENAWSAVSFGANPNGIYGASLDDPMHYCDSGSFKYLAEVIFGSMTKTEREKIETMIKLKFLGKYRIVGDYYRPRPLLHNEISMN